MPGRLHSIQPIISVNTQQIGLLNNLASKEPISLVTCFQNTRSSTAAGKNYLYAKQGRAATNDLADSVRQLYINDSLLTIQYNKVMANGKWNHMMDQTHIGYTWWQQPPVNKMPEVKTITPIVQASM